MILYIIYITAKQTQLCFPRLENECPKTQKIWEKNTEIMEYKKTEKKLKITKIYRARIFFV